MTAYVQINNDIITTQMNIHITTKVLVAQDNLVKHVLTLVTRPCF